MGHTLKAGKDDSHEWLGDDGSDHGYKMMSNEETATTGLSKGKTVLEGKDQETPLPFKLTCSS